MAFLSYNKDEKLEFNYKRACGLWLIVVAAVIAIATMTGGKTNNKYASIQHWVRRQLFLNQHEQEGAE